MKDNVHEMAVQSLAIVLLEAFCVCCGGSAQVKSFRIDPPTVCPGQPVQVQWDVSGRASLREQRAANDWAEGVVPSTGSITVAPVSATIFTITALDANRAADGWQGSGSVQVVPVEAKPRLASAACDPDSRKCTGSFVIDGPESLRVAAISMPIEVRGGVEQEATLGVTHGNWQQKIAPRQSVPVDLPATGAWTIDVDLGPNDMPSPPPKLGVTLRFACDR